MFDNFSQREVEGLAQASSSILLDWGDLVTAGRRPRRMLVLLAWLLTAGTSLAIYKRFPWLFDHFPGWAVLAGGFWVILVVVTLGLSAAAVKHSAIEGASRSRPPI